jgi:hypothetical protein
MQRRISKLRPDVELKILVIREKQMKRRFVALFPLMVMGIQLVAVSAAA